MRSVPAFSAVIPVFNDDEVLPEIHNCRSKVLKSLKSPSETININDGSKDQPLDVIEEFNDQRGTMDDLSRSPGKEVALTAGLKHAIGEAVLIAADLQDPAELIPDLVVRFHNRHDMIYAHRTARDGESLLKDISAQPFYRLIHSPTNCEVHKS